ncbi:MAG: hypothetical protein ABIT09_11820 [Croceibacterium sp.]
MYEADDPRSGLAGPVESAGASAFAPSSYSRFYDTDPGETGKGHRTWYTRGQNFVVCYAKVEPGATFERIGQPDEYVLLLHEPSLSATVEANGEVREVPGYTITMIPPGDSKIVCHSGGQIVRLITTRSADVVAKASNAASYRGAHPQVPEFRPWPTPTGGFKIRSYSLDIPDAPGRFGKLFRCTTFMVNVFPPQGARDVTKLSPHHHDDFEQGSLALKGWYVHHLRWPWTANQHDWRGDEHETCGSPSLCVIPPKVIHTSAPSDPHGNVLIDIFSPPRVDFSDMAGWVLNADDYPRP